MIGTAVGAVGIVVLTACFPQERIGFLLGLALWGAVWGLMATLLRNFAAFAAALAGLTPAIIASDELGATGGANGEVRWAAARQGRVDAAQVEKKCRAYRIHFYDAVTARQAASICEDGIHRQRDLDLLDSEIDAFNNLIAAQCSG